MVRPRGLTSADGPTFVNNASTVPDRRNTPTPGHPGQAAGELPVTVAIITYNGRAHVGRCLKSLEGSGAFATIVVDNCSTDGTVAFVLEHFSNVRVIANKVNGGFGAAANQALREARSRYVMLLNADTEVSRDTVGVLSRQLDAHAAAAVAGPRLQDVDGTHQPSSFPFPGTWRWLFENSPVSLLTRGIPYLRDRSITFQRSPGWRAVPWVMGAVMLLRREPVLGIGGFDESFFMYYEEVDLCYRLSKSGWETHFVPDCTVMHLGGGSTSQVKDLMLRQRLRSTVRYYRRHCSRLRRWLWLAMVRARWAHVPMAAIAVILLRADGARWALARAELGAWWRSAFDLPADGVAPGKGREPAFRSRNAR